MIFRVDDGLKQSLGELIVILGAFVIDFWVLSGFNNPLAELPALCVVGVVCLRSIKRRGGFARVLSFSVGSPTQAWLEMFTLTAFPAIALVAWSAAIRGPYDEIPLRIAQPSTVVLTLWIGQHLVLAALQQGVLQFVLRPVIGEIIKRPTIATATTAVLFGALHLPCSILVLATTALGVMWMVLYSRTGRIVTVIVSHAVLSSLAFVVVPPQWNCELLVGISAQRNLTRYRILRSRETREVLEFVTSNQYFVASGGTQRGFIESLYRDMLGRAAAEAEIQHWVDLIDEGHSRNRIAIEFAGSPEFRVSTQNRPDSSKGP